MNSIESHLISSIESRHFFNRVSSHLISCMISMILIRLIIEEGHHVTGHLGWIRLGYGEMTEEFRVPSDHLESLHFFAGISTEISVVLMTSVR